MFEAVTDTTISCNLGRLNGPVLSLFFIDIYDATLIVFSMEQHTLKNGTSVGTSNYPLLRDISRGQNYNLYLNIVHFFNASFN
jgi:hypothetical protein